MREWKQLTKEQSTGDNKLEILKKIGTKCAVSPLAIGLDAFVSGVNHIDGNKSLEGRAGWIWTSSRDDDNYLDVVDSDGSRGWDSDYSHDGGVRLASPFSNESEIPSNVVRREDGIEYFEEGELPSKPVSIETEESLKEKLSNGEYVETGKDYPLDFSEYQETGDLSDIKKVKEYIKDGKKYAFIKYLVSLGYDATEELPNVGKIKENDIICYEVKPVRNLIDREDKMIIWETAMLSGIQGRHVEKYINWFINTIDPKNSMLYPSVCENIKEKDNNISEINIPDIDTSLVHFPSFLNDVATITTGTEYTSIECQTHNSEIVKIEGHIITDSKVFHEVTNLNVEEADGMEKLFNHFLETSNSIVIDSEMKIIKCSSEELSENLKSALELLARYDKLCLSSSTKIILHHFADKEMTKGNYQRIRK